jgi:Na+-transporting methylmalonyl-CoA/oxaloacetate decarboxylase gamma subunit
MANIDWNIVGTVAGMGYLMTFIAVGILTLFVYLIGFIITRRTRVAPAKKTAEKCDK